MNRFRVYCGPTVVPTLSVLLTKDVANVFEGTEHLYFSTYLTLHELVQLLNTVSSGFTQRDVTYLSAA